MITSIPIQTYNNETCINGNQIICSKNSLTVKLKGHINYIEAIKIKKDILEIMANLSGELELIIDFCSVESISQEGKKTFNGFKTMKKLKKVSLKGISNSYLFTNIFSRIKKQMLVS